MTEFLPRTFFEVAGGVLGLAALIFSFISLFEKVRVHSLRVLAIFVVAALALFGNHISVYFAAVFIIATAVTELEFLQTLAAIIRGNKEYFTYKIGTMSSDEKLRLLRAEFDQLSGEPKKTQSAANDGLDETVSDSSRSDSEREGDAAVDFTNKSEGGDVTSSVKASNQPQDNIPTSNPAEEKIVKYEPQSIPSKPRRVATSPPARARGIMSSNKVLRKILKIESRALDYMESMYGLPIRRDVVFRSADHELALDGVMKFPESSRQPDEIFEVVYFPKIHNIGRLIDVIYKLPAKLAKYAVITKREPTCQLVIVLSDNEEFTREQFAELTHAINVAGLNGCHVVNEADLETYSSLRDE